MKRRFSRHSMARIGFVLALTVACTTAVPAASAAKSEVQPTYPHVATHYYNGDMRVDLVLALDELVVDGGPDAKTAARLAAPAADAAALSAQARTVRDASPGAKVRAALYDPSVAKRGDENRRELTNRLAVKFKPDADVPGTLKTHGLSVAEKVGYSDNTYILESTSGDLFGALDAANALYESGKVEFATPEIARVMSRRAVPNDPQYGNQWHLKNTGSNAPGTGEIAGNDLNVESAWDSVTGTGVLIAITDDSLQTTHPDLSANARTDIDIDIRGGDADPAPESGDGHGTCCAGVASAKGNNGVGVCGVSWNASLVGVRLIGGAQTDSMEAQAMAHQATAANAADRVSINSNSWGPTDNGTTLETFGPLTKASIENCIANGRGGKGTIFTWAAGNGLEDDDNVNLDGYASSRYTIAVGATGPNGVQSYYSEPGAGMLVNASSSYTGGGITTVDVLGSGGYDAGDYTAAFGGTSSACPAVAGAVALILQANPNLGWRDVQHILVNSSTKNDSADSGWVFNGAGNKFNHKYGFGRVNAAAAVALASSWTNVPAEATPLTAASGTISLAIPDNNATGVSNQLALTGVPANFKVEAVEVTVDITHTYRGDLAIVLTSPSGMQSQLMTTRNDSGDNYSNWMFTSVAHWGENPAGTWTLKIADGFATDVGTLNSWSIKVHGYVNTNSSNDDSHEPDGSWTAADNRPSILTGGSDTFTLLNEDWHRLALAPGHVLRVIVDQFDSNTDNVQIQLYDSRVGNSAGYPINVAASYGTTNSETVFYVDRTAISLDEQNAGFLYLRVYSEGDAYPGVTYRVRTFDLGRDDAFEPNNEPCQPIDIARNTTYSDLIAGDDDVFRVTTTGLSTIHVNVLQGSKYAGQLYWQVLEDNGSCGYNVLHGFYTPNLDTPMEADVNVSGRSSVLVRVYPGFIGGTNMYTLRVD